MQKLLHSPWFQAGWRFLWYLFLLLLIFLCYDTPQRDFRYWGL